MYGLFLIYTDMYKGLRDYLNRLGREDELIRISTPVSTDEEIAEITERIVKTYGGGKALLFENTGKPWPVVTNMFGSERRMAMALGSDNLRAVGERVTALLSELASPKQGLGDKLRMLPLLAEMSRWMPRQSHSNGECQQVVVAGDAVDLTQLPVLKCREHDAGRFITLPMVNTIDPESGMRNVGMYRMQILDRNTTAMHWHIHKTGARHYDAYRRLGRRMPVSVALGGDPAYTYAATAPMPDNMDEYLLAGFLRRRPVKLVKCITNDIYVPTDCDFVIEGYVDPSEDPVREGPFADHTGFYSLDDFYPKFHVTAITSRRDAVWPATIVGIPPQEDAAIAVATERIFLAPIRMALQPEVCDMTMPVEGTAHNIAVISVANRYDGQAVKVAQSLWGAGQMMFNKYMAVVPAATDVRDNRALAKLLRSADTPRCITRCEGIYDILDHATDTQGFGGKVMIDLTSAAIEFEQMVLPESFVPAGKIDSADAADEWGALFVFAKAGETVDVPHFLAENGIAGVKYVLIVDTAAEKLTMAERVWLAAADSDPRRDLTVTSDGVIIIDGRSKCPGKVGNPARFPNVAVSSRDVISLVDRRWSEYGLGEFVTSPSERYRSLLLSETEEW